MRSAHARALRRAADEVSARYREKLLWWNLPTPPHRNITFVDIIEENPTSVEWHSVAETSQVLAKMSAVNIAKVEAANAQAADGRGYDASGEN